jgi:hypothetical protein
MSQTVGYDFPFVVNVPAGTSVLVATVRQGQSSAHTSMFVHDVGAKIVYCGQALREVFAGHTTSTFDPLAVAARSGWMLVESVQGTVVGAIVSATHNTYDHRGPSTALATQLFVEVPTAAYR